MRKLLILFKVILSTMYSISHMKYKISKDKKEIIKLAVIPLVLILSLAPVLGGYTFFMASSYDSLYSIGQQGAIITNGVVSSSLIIVFFGFFFVISTLYFSNDTEYLVALPLKPYQIIGAKFGVILVSEYLTELPLVLPPIIIYGIKSGAGLLYWVYSILAVIVIPVIPLCITSVIAVAVMRVTNIGKKKDLFRTVGGIIAVIVMLALQTYIQRSAISGGGQKINELLFSKNGLVSMIASSFPPAAWISIGLIEYSSLRGLMFILLFLGVSIAALVIFGYLGEKLFLGGYIGSSEASSRRKRLQEGELSRGVSGRGRIGAIFLREFKILNRVPIFFMNCVFPVILVPGIFVMMYFTGGSEITQGLSMVVNSGGNLLVPTMILSGIAIFSVISNMTAPTSISREGALFFVAKYIPIAPREQILGKMFHALFLAVIGNMAVLITIAVLTGLPIANILIAFIISTIAAVAITEISLIIDLFKPYLNWDNPQKAVKQNMNGIISMLLNSLWSGGVLYLISVLVKKPVTGYIVSILVFIAVSIVMYKLLMLYAAKRYREIEA